MPDLTIEVACVCKSTEEFVAEIAGSKGAVYAVRLGPSSGPYQYEWSCTCAAGTYRGKCRHIEQAKAMKRCCWNAEMATGMEPAYDEDGHPSCPECGGEVVFHRVAV